MLEKYAGKVTGSEAAPKLFDERRTGSRMTKNLELKLRKNLDSAEAYPSSQIHGSVTSYGEVSSVGFSKHDGNTISGTAGIIRDITERKIAEQVILASLKEKETLLKEIHHRVKNNLQVISSLLNLRSFYVKGASNLSFFTDCQAQIQSMAMVHEQMYQTGNFGNVAADEYIRGLCERLIETYNVSVTQVETVFDLDKISLDIDTSTILALLLNELVTNSLKHAFPDGRTGKIHIKLKRNAIDSACTLDVSDNGIGLPAYVDMQNGETLGFRLITSLVEQLSGTMELESDHGASFSISFPLPEVK